MPTPSPATVRFDSRQAPSSQAGFDAWREAVGATFDVALVSGEPLEQFCARFVSRHLGAMVVASVQAAGQHFSRSSRVIARTGLDHYLVQLYVDGGYEACADGTPMRVRPGDISVLDLSRPMRSRAAPFRTISLFMARQRLEERIGGCELHGRVIDGGTAMGRILAAHLQTLATPLPPLDVEDLRSLNDATANLVAACAATHSHAGLDDRVHFRGRRQAAMDFVERHLARAELSVADVCEEVGASRAVLYRWFEAYGGFASYVRERRLNRAFNLIAAARRQPIVLGVLAATLGFRSDTSFGRAFRRRFDISPSELLRLVRRGDSPQALRTLVGAHGGSAVAEFDNWIRRLSVFA